MKNQIKPGMFGIGAAQDSLRRQYDLLNSQIVYSEKRPEILFFGDSITFCWDINMFFSDYGYIVNRGIGGDCTTYLLRRSDADVFQLNPKKIVYMAGINDLIGTCPDLWYKEQGADREQTIKNILANTEEFIKKCGNTPLYIGSVTPVDMCLPYSLAKLEDAVVTVNDGIKAICEKYGVTYVDYHSMLKSETDNKLRAGLSTDGIHPEGEAYTIMSKILRGALDK